jgi:hypothetical protein
LHRELVLKAVVIRTAAPVEVVLQREADQAGDRILRGFCQGRGFGFFVINPRAAAAGGSRVGGRKGERAMKAGIGLSRRSGCQCEGARDTGEEAVMFQLGPSGNYLSGMN